MKVKIEAVKTGAELTEEFLKELVSQNINASLEDVKILVTNKSGAEIDISSDKLRILYSK